MDVGRVRICLLSVASLLVLADSNCRGTRQSAGFSSDNHIIKAGKQWIPERYSRYSNIPRRFLRGRKLQIIVGNHVLKQLIAEDETSGARRILSGIHNPKDKNNIIAVSIACSVMALSLVILLLVCIVKCRKTSPLPREGEGQPRDDENPLPTFGSREVSPAAACSQQSCGIGKLSDKTSMHSSPEVDHFSAAEAPDTPHNSSHFSEDNGTVHGNNQSLLPLSPGKSNLSVPEPPPPKAPPMPKVALPLNTPKPGNSQSLLPLPPGRSCPPATGPPPPPPPKSPGTNGPPPPPPPKSPGTTGPPPPPPPKSPGTNGPPPPPPKSPSTTGAPPPPPPISLGTIGPPPSPPPKSPGTIGPPPPPPSKSPGTIGAQPPPPPKSPSPKPGTPPPPPPPKSPTPTPPKFSKLGPSPLGHNKKGNLFPADEGSYSSDPDSPKAKLKPFFWEKVPANPDHSMVWDVIKQGSFQIDEDAMESLFHYVPADKHKNDHSKDSTSSQPQQPRLTQIIDPKKAQNLSILLKAWNITNEEICDALMEGDEIPVELIQTLLKMAPTSEEEAKLRSFSGDVSQLGPAERFLKLIVDIPFAFKRLEALLFMYSLQEEASSIAESLGTLEVACNELRNSRLFLKLLEAVLKTGNRMNDGTFRGGAHAFKLDTLLKLSDVKGTDDCKTTLLHYVVQEIIRSEGLKAAHRLTESQSFSSVKTEDLQEDSSQETEEERCNLGLQVVSGLGSELENVKKAADIDGDIITTTVSRLGHSLLQTKEFLKSELMNVNEASDFCKKFNSFMDGAEADVKKLLEDEKRVTELVRNTADYFHGKAGKDEGLRLFTIVRDFLIMLDTVCNEVKNSANWPSSSSKTTPKKDSLTSSLHHDPSSPDVRKMLFPAIKTRPTDDFNSDEEES